MEDYGQGSGIREQDLIYELSMIGQAFRLSTISEVLQGMYTLDFITKEVFDYAVETLGKNGPIMYPDRVKTLVEAINKIKEVYGLPSVPEKRVDSFDDFIDSMNVFGDSHKKNVEQTLSMQDTSDKPGFKVTGRYGNKGVISKVTTPNVSLFPSSNGKIAEQFLSPQQIYNHLDAEDIANILMDEVGGKFKVAVQVEDNYRTVDVVKRAKLLLQNAKRLHKKKNEFMQLGMNSRQFEELIRSALLDFSDCFSYVDIDADGDYKDLFCLYFEDKINEQAVINILIYEAKLHRDFKENSQGTESDHEKLRQLKFERRATNGWNK